MNPSYICLQCRRRITLLGVGMAARMPIVKGKANQRTFISLNNPPPSISTATLDVPLNIHPKTEGGEGSDSLPTVHPRAAPKRPRRAYSRSKDPGDQLEALFESARTPAATTPTPVLQYYEHAATLKSMLLDQKVSAAELWRFFIQHFPQDAMEVESMDGGVSPAMAFIRDSAYGGKLLLKRLSHAYLEQASSPTSDGQLPTLTEVTSVFTDLGILRGRDWTDSISAVIANMLKKDEALRKGAEYEAVLADLVECWKAVGRGPRQKDEVDSTENDWARSIYNAMAQYPSKTSHGTVGFFNRALAPTFSLTQAMDLPLVALATFFLLTEHARTQIDNQYESFTNALGHLICAASLSKAYLKDSASKGHSLLKPGQNAKFIREILNDNWTEIIKRAAPHRPFQQENFFRKKIVRATPEEAIKDVSDVEIRKDIVQLEKLWSKYQPSSGDSVLCDIESRNLAKLYNSFIRAFMSLRRPNRAIDVWNDMVGNGVSPGILSWTALLDGCKVSRDWEAMQDVWSRMEGLYVKPDNTCWSIRMFCLIDCNKFDLAILALDQMGRSWLKAARNIHGAKKTVRELVDIGHIDGTPKPGIRTVNASVDGFLKKRRSQEAHRILAWAGKFGVYPNVDTYNILLRSLIHDDQTKEAMILLQHMHKTRIAPNSTTFTVILSETFKRSKHYTLDEQNHIVDNIFNEMERAGLKATIHTYGKIIHEMLHVGSGDHGSANISAVNAVMQRMGREKVMPTAFIYTDFLNYYFNCTPPDLDGVRSIIARYKSEDDHANSVFWDLVIKNYAKVGDTASAMRILGQARDNPALEPPKWATYYVLLTALAENEEWEIARTLVKNLVLETGGPDDDPDPKHWHKRDFWMRARELKLMES